MTEHNVQSQKYMKTEQPEYHFRFLLPKKVVKPVFIMTTLFTIKISLFLSTCVTTVTCHDIRSSKLRCSYQLTVKLWMKVTNGF